MRIPGKSSALLVVLCLLLASCGEKQPEESPKSEIAKPEPAPAAQPQRAEASPKSEPAKAAPTQAAQPKPAAAPAEQKPAPAAAPSETQKAPTASAAPAQPAVTAQAAPPSAPVAEQKKPTAKDVVILKGSPLGAVKFEHKLHQQRAGNKCETCHHPSHPEKPGKWAQESCLDCHTKPPQPGMKTGLPAAFHNPAAKAGLCIDCHLTQNAQGKKAPAKCMDCHKKENT